jgi:hypothetical protein
MICQCPQRDFSVEKHLHVFQSNRESSKKKTSSILFEISKSLPKPVEHHSQMRQNLIVVVNMLFVDSILHQDIDD